MTPRFAPFAVLLVVLGSLCACDGRRSQPRAEAGAPAPTTTTTTAPVTTPPASQPARAPLTVTIKDLRNKKGQVIFGVFKSADGFPNVESKSVYWEVKDAADRPLTFTRNLPAGRYAASVLHDENRSGDMDRGVAGIPLEGYGVTNNPKPRLRAATFDEAAFTLPPEGAETTISVQYF
jgi:uncharacterized protein (DUF2141 family)